MILIARISLFKSFSNNQFDLMFNLFCIIVFYWNILLIKFVHVIGFFFRANEIHLFINNKIQAIDKKVIQSCWACRLSNRFCYVTTKIFEKCVSCAISSRIIKKCEIIFIEYVNIYSFHDDFIDVTFFWYLIWRMIFLSFLLFLIFLWILLSWLFLTRFEIWLKTKFVFLFQ